MGPIISTYIPSRRMTNGHKRRVFLEWKRGMAVCIEMTVQGAGRRRALVMRQDNGLLVLSSGGVSARMQPLTGLGAKHGDAAHHRRVGSSGVREVAESPRCAGVLARRRVSDRRGRVHTPAQILSRG